MRRPGARRAKRGRPYDPNARRHQTTRAGRRGEVDRGSSRLREKKRAATSREDVEMTPAGVLYGFGHIDNVQYSALGWITHLLRRIACSFGRDASPSGVWAALLAAASRTPPGALPIIGDYGAHLAIALTMAHLDGNGNFTSTFVVNEPTPGSTTGERTLVTGSVVGTYTVNCDGTGVITRFAKTPSGVLPPAVSDFVITRAVQSQSEGGVLIATELVDAQRTPGFIVPGGTFLTRTYTRLSDRP